MGVSTVWYLPACAGARVVARHTHPVGGADHLVLACLAHVDTLVYIVAALKTVHSLSSIYLFDNQ